jgi:hypothetical protein
VGQIGVGGDARDERTRKAGRLCAGVGVDGIAGVLGQVLGHDGPRLDGVVVHGRQCKHTVNR